ncbi:MAG: rRNA adenine N-6-methyltransferase family protein [Syntrophomonas sp.]
MDKNMVFNKFGDHYVADDMTFLMGIDLRFTDHLACRMKDCVVLETCTGGGFSTISLAKYAKHVYTVEIDSHRLSDAQKNVEIAGLKPKVSFINQDIMCREIEELIPDIDAAFLDPDWAVSGENHQFRFIHSNTRPPSDVLLNMILLRTSNVTLIQPPFISPREFEHLPPHECESLYLNGRHELFCLHFGKLARFIGNSEFRV